LAERDASITLLEQTLAALYTSHSWRMTKLFRVIKKTIKSF
jgi:hypothetical protein